LRSSNHYLSADVVGAIQRSGVRSVRQWRDDRRRRITAGYFHTPDGDAFVTADHVIDDPREPRIVPTGILDERGMMLVRVTIPIKCKMGFARMLPEDPGEVTTIVPEDMLAVSDIGEGLGFVEPHEVEGDEDE
jgi:hypothetical protein